MKTISGVSVIVPAYNEEKNIRGALQNISLLLNSTSYRYEIVVVNDGSSDKTSQVVADSAKNNKHIILIEQKHRGLGYTIREGIQHASMSYITVFPGDNDMAPSSIMDLLKEMGRKDIVISYIADTKKRSYFRRFLSYMFLALLNIMLGLRLKYYNGPFICKTKLAQSVKLKSEGFTIYAELKIRLIKGGATYKEIPFYHTGRKYGRSKALSFQSIIQTGKALVFLFREFTL